MREDDAASLADRQAALVRALVAGADIPSGFDPAAVRAAAGALLHKRARETAARFPELAHAAGPGFIERFIDWARDRPKESTAADAVRFARDTGIPWPAAGPGPLARVRRIFRGGRR